MHQIFVLIAIEASNACTNLFLYSPLLVNDAKRNFFFIVEHRKWMLNWIQLCQNAYNELCMQAEKSFLQLNHEKLRLFSLALFPAHQPPCLGVKFIFIALFCWCFNWFLFQRNIIQFIKKFFLFIELMKQFCEWLGPCWC